jgi:hypothetical protein
VGSGALANFVTKAMGPNRTEKLSHEIIALGDEAERMVKAGYEKDERSLNVEARLKQVQQYFDEKEKMHEHYHNSDNLFSLEAIANHIKLANQRGTLARHPVSKERIDASMIVELRCQRLKDKVRCQLEMMSVEDTEMGEDRTSGVVFGCNKMLLAELIGELESGKVDLLGKYAPNYDAESPGIASLESMRPRKPRDLHGKKETSRGDNHARWTQIENMGTRRREVQRDGQRTGVECEVWRADTRNFPRGGKIQRHARNCHRG